MPAAVPSDECIRLFRPPTAGLVAASLVVVIENWIDHRPGSLNRVLTGEERGIAYHRVSQEPLVGRFLSWLFI